MEETYLIISIAIGIVVIIDGILLARHFGHFSENNIINITTNIEMSWAIVSILALFFLNFTGWMYAIPAIYVAHNVSGWVYGHKLVNDHSEKGLPLESFKIPYWHVLFGIFIGIVFTVLSVIAVWQLFS
jgi:hypothetical protein